MKKNYCKFKIISFFICLLAHLPFISHAQAVKVLADEVTFTSSNNKTTLNGCGPAGILPCINQPTALNSQNALSNNNSFARLLASPGLAANLGAYQGIIELSFPETLPAETWSYVRVRGDEDLFGALLGGSLGELLGNVLGAVLLGNQGIEIQARNSSGTTVLSRTSTQGFDTERVKLVVDDAGNYLLAIKPDQAYDRVRVINRSISVLGLGSEYLLDVYHAFYVDGDDECGEFKVTSFDGSGISLDLLDIGGAGVTGLANAIDNDIATSSSISIGTLGVGASMYQKVYFNSPGTAEDYFKISLSVANGSVLNADLLGSIEVRAYNGSNAEPVYIKKLHSGLINDLDLLGLLRSGQTVTLPFGPGVAFDRVSVGYNSLVSLSALSNSPLRLHNVARYGPNCPDPDPIEMPDPTEPMLSNRDCEADLLDFAYADFPYNAVDGNNDTYTTLEASSGALLGAGAYEGFVELGFEPRAAGTTSYIRIDFDEAVLYGLLNGTVGELVGGVVDNVLFGSHYFTVEAKNSGTPVLAASSNTGFSNQPVKIVQDKNDHFYVAVTPNSAYNSIRVTERLGAILGLGEVRTMNVYHVCTSTGFEECEQAFSTYSESSGINLDLLGVGAAGVTDAGAAIDDNPATASKISIGAAGVAGSVYQHVNFHSLSDAADHFRVKLKMEGGNLLTAELLGSIVIKAYQGDEEVFSQRLRDGLISELDLLGLLQNGEVISIPFGPGRAFDRIAIGIESLVSANVIQSPLELYSVERFSANCPDPELELPEETIPPFNSAECAVNVLSWDNANFPFNTIDGHNDTYSTLTAGTGTVLGLNSYTSHIELGYNNPVPAFETSYIRIDFEDDILNALVGGNLGGELADLLGTVALGDHYFTVSPRDAGGNPIYTASSQNQFGNQEVKIVQDAFGRFYIAVTADVAYQSVRIDHYLTALIGGNNTATMHVYGMCREADFDPCEEATFTSFDGSGIALDLLDIRRGGVFNPQYAIDANSSNYATINLGIAGIGASVYQNIYFKTKSSVTDQLRLRLQLDQPGLLNLDLAGSYRVILYNGNDEVYNETLQTALINNVDLLGLLNSGGIQELTIEPGVAFDRVQFGLQSVAAVNTSAPLRFYGITRISEDCPDPDFVAPPFLSPTCAEELVDAAFADNLQNLFDGNHNSYATINSRGGVLGSLGAFAGHVTLGYGAGVVVPAGTTSYIRIDAEDGLLNSLLGGSIGGVLAGIVDNILLGDHYFNVTVNDINGNPLFTGSSQNSFAGTDNQIRIVQDAAGRYYLSIAPNVAYNSIRIEDHTDALLLGQGNRINVYGLCYENDFEGCAVPFTTSFDGSGLTLDLGNIGGYGVANADRVLDDNNNSNYSEISLGLLSVAGSVQQNIQFNKAIGANGVFKIKMAIGSGVLDAGVFERIDIVGYNDGQLVYEQTLDNAVLGNVNLVDLFNNGNSPEIRVAPGVAVDELAVRLRSLASVTAVPNVRLFYIQQDCETPLFTTWKSYIIDNNPATTAVSGGEEVQYTIHVRNQGTVPITDFIITDAVPSHTTWVEGSGGTLEGNIVTFNNINVAGGATETVNFSVTVDANLSGITEIANIALVKADLEDPGTETFPPLDNENPTDPDDTGDTGTNIPVDPVESLITWKSYTVNGDASITTVTGGEEVVYIIFVSNTGNQDLLDLVVADTLPEGLRYQSGGMLNGNTVNFTIPSLQAGETSAGYSFLVEVEEDLSGIETINNIAFVSSSNVNQEQSYPPVNNENPTDPNINEGPGTVIEVDPLHAVTLSKLGVSNNAESNGKAELGDEITYTLTVTNTGNKALSDIEIRDELPAEVALLDGGGGVTDSGTLIFSISSLAVGESEVFTFRVLVESVAVGVPIVNNAEAVFIDENGDAASEQAVHAMPTDCIAINAGNINLSTTSEEICEGETVTLSASLDGLTVANPQFRWYTNENLSGSFLTGASQELSPDSNITYYVVVEAEGYCYSTPPAMIEVQVNELPEVPETVRNITISEGSGTLLTATLDPLPEDIEIVWYNESGTELAIGETFDTGLLEVGSYTYFAGTRDLNSGCESVSRAEINLTVTPVGPVEDCTIANSQTNGTNFLCLLCGVDNPGNAVDGNINSFSRFIAPAAVTGGVWQELIFPQGGSAGDTVVVTLGTGGSLLDLDVLGGLRFETYNGSAGNSDGGRVDGITLKLRLLSSDDKGQVTLVAGANFDRVRVTYRPLLGVLNSGWRIYQAQINYPAPTTITDDVEVCVGEVATLEAVASGSTSLRWYDAAIGGNLLEEGNSYTTEVQENAGTITYYIAVVTGSCEDPVRIPVNLTVNESPTAADIEVTGNEVPICEGDTVVLTPTVASGSTLVTGEISFNWYLDEDKITVINDGDTNGSISYSIDPTGILTIAGLSDEESRYTYYVSVVADNSCENIAGDLEEVVVEIQRSADSEEITALGSTICAGETFGLTASSSTITDPIFTWYADEELTTEITDLIVSPTATTAYYVTVQGEGICENLPGQAAEVTVTVNPTATATDINVENAEICAGESFLLSASSSTITDGVFTWYADEELTIPITDASVSPTVTTVYYVTVQGEGVCENILGEAAEVAVTVNPTATAADVTATGGEICAGESFPLSASSSTISDGVFTWYADEELTTEITDLNVSPTVNTIYYVTVQGDGVCENLPSQAAEVTVTVNPTATASDITATGGEICAGESFPLSASSSTVTDGVFTWYADEELTTEITDLNVSPTVTTVYYVTVQGDGTCENLPSEAAEVTITVNPTATVMDIDVENVEICAGESIELTASSSTITDGVFTWYADEELTTEITDLNVSPTATTTYYVTVQGEGVCENLPGEAAEVTVTVSPTATASDITATGGEICAGESFELIATSTTVTSPIFTWYADEELTTEVTDLNVSPTATTTYYVTVQGEGVCENLSGQAAEVTITVNPTATASDITATGGEICAGESFPLSATSSTITDGIFTWYADEELTTPITDPSASPTVTTTYYVTVQGEGICENIPGQAAEVTITVNPTATAADIDVDNTEICAGESIELTASSSTITDGVFTWYADEELTTEITDLNINPAVTSTYYVTVQGEGVCENLPGQAAEVTITVNPTATASDITATGGEICAGESFPLSATSSTITDGIFTWYADEELTTPITDPSASPTVTTTYYVTVQGEGICENIPGQAAEVTITVNPTAITSDIITTGGEICMGQSFPLSATSSTITDGVFTWYADEELTTEITDLNVSPTVTTVYYVTVQGEGVCENLPGQSAEVTVTVNPTATASDITATGGEICAGESFPFSASSSTITDGIFTWYADEELTTPITDVSVSPTVTTTYYVTVQGEGVCENLPGQAAEVTVTVNPTATASDITATGGEICAGESFPLSATSSTITDGIFTWYADEEFTTEITDLNVSPTVTTVYYVTVQGDGVCENIPGQAAEVTVTVNPTATASDITATGGEICAGESFPLSASSSTITNGVFTWYADEELTTEITDLNVSPTTTTVYYVTVQGERFCENLPGQAAEVTVTVNPTATATDINVENAEICAGESFPLSASSSTITDGVLTWYADEELTTPITDPSASPTVTTTYYVTVQGEGVCENIPGQAAEVTVTVNPTATASDITATGGEICAGESFPLSATSSTVTDGVFTWYADEELTTEITDLNVSPTVNTVYYVTVQGDGVCENIPGQASKVTITVNTTATASDITATAGEICAGENFELAATSPTIADGVFTWYADEELTILITDPSVSPAVTTTYYVTVQGEGICENLPGEAAEVTIMVNPTATAADITATGGEICAGESFPLSASSSTITDGVFTWYADEELTTPITDVSVSPTVTTVYYVTVQGDGVCENIPGQAAEVTVTVNPTATASDITATGGEICAGESFPLSATSSTITDGIFTWYADEELTTEITDLNVSPTVTTVYYVTVQGESVCENIPGQAAEVTVIVNPAATASDITATAGEICAGENFELAATSPTIADGFFTWYADEELTIPITDPSVSPTVTTVYYVTVQGEGVCENTPGQAAELTITVNPTATAADIRAIGGEICAGDPFELTASSSTINDGLFTWYADQALTTRIASLTVRPTVTTTYYVTVRGAGVCENVPGEAAAVTVMVNSVPMPTTNSPIQSFCTVVNPTIGDLQVNESNVIWYNVPTGGNALSLEAELEWGAVYYAALTNVSGCVSHERLAITVSECAEISVAKMAETASAIVGEMFDYTITVTNNGPVAATNITVTDVLPDELTFVEAIPAGEASGNRVVWNIDELGAGESILIRLTAMALQESTGVINQVVVRGDNHYPDEDETDPLPIGGNDVDLSITKQVSSPMVEVGKEFTYQLRVTNNSANTAYNILAIDDLPEQVSYLESSSNANETVAYDPDSRRVTWTIQQLAPQGEALLQIRVRADRDGEVSNTALVEAAGQEDTNDADNASTVTHSQVKIEIPNAFSPNGDNINDTWEIVGLPELYPDNKVIIVNRWGGEVYRSSNYQNDWNGGSLNEGTYYYQLTIRDSAGRESQFTGYVTILR